MKFDLHLHTNFSACANPEQTWEKLLSQLTQNQIDVASITDHNTCLFHVISQFVDINRYYQGIMIPGMECDVVDDGVTYEVLAYGFDVMKTFHWADETYHTLADRQTFMKEQLQKLALAYGLKIDSTVPFNPRSYAHQYIYENLLKYPENQKFFTQYRLPDASSFYRRSVTDPSFPLYLDMSLLWPSAQQVVDFIHAAGGIVVLAHPHNYKANVNPEQLLQLALKYHFDGIEVYHPSCNQKQIDDLLAFCQKHQLLVTGGSDYHAKVDQQLDYDWGVSAADQVRAWITKKVLPE